MGNTTSITTKSGIRLPIPGKRLLNRWKSQAGNLIDSDLPMSVYKKVARKYNKDAWISAFKYFVVTDGDLHIIEYLFNKIGRLEYHAVFMLVINKDMFDILCDVGTFDQPMHKPKLFGNSQWSLTANGLVIVEFPPPRFVYRGINLPSLHVYSEPFLVGFRRVDVYVKSSYMDVSVETYMYLKYGTYINSTPIIREVSFKLEDMDTFVRSFDGYFPYHKFSVKKKLRLMSSEMPTDYNDIVIAKNYSDPRCAKYMSGDMIVKYFNYFPDNVIKIMAKNRFWEIYPNLSYSDRVKFAEMKRMKIEDCLNNVHTLDACLNKFGTSAVIEYITSKLQNIDVPELESSDRSFLEDVWIVDNERQEIYGDDGEHGLRDCIDGILSEF